jgi:hypothetical protein
MPQDAVQHNCTLGFGQELVYIGPTPEQLEPVDVVVPLGRKAKIVEI